MKITQVFSEGAGGAPVRRPYIIAEAGVNHEGSMELARRLVAEAAEAGADAIKFQTYKAETLAAKQSPAYWDLSKEPTRSQFELFKKYDRFWKGEFEALKTECERRGIEFLSTPFDAESARFLADLMPAFKVSSSDITNRPFIELICSFGKPVILSTGASSLAEIEEAAAWVKGAGDVPLALLHCVLNYPTADKDAHLGMILGLQRAFPQHIIGYSDHTLPKDMASLEIATLFGARILEKHFTHDKSLPGNDHYHAMDRHDLAAFRARLDAIFERIGAFEVRALAEEEPARLHARRSLVARSGIRKGERIDASHLTWKRPASGISPKHYAEVVGRRAAVDIDEDAILQWEMLDAR
jgi:N-acetylneuraminate synthase